MNALRIQNRQAEILAGAAFLALGSWFIWDAYDGRGRKRPWALNLLPGV